MSGHTSIYRTDLCINIQTKLNMSGQPKIGQVDILQSIGSPPD
jgi:hypothetical protein